MDDLDGQRGHPPRTRVFYDGGCGLCHRSVRFVVARDANARFRFAPIGGVAWSELPEAARAALPDSLIVAHPDGRLLVRSGALVYLLRGLGWGWRLVGVLVWLVPRPLRDLVYRGVARIRRRLFRPPPSACPLVPTHLQERFEP